MNDCQKKTLLELQLSAENTRLRENYDKTQNWKPPEKC